MKATQSRRLGKTSKVKPIASCGGKSTWKPTPYQANNSSPEQLAKAIDEVLFMVKGNRIDTDHKINVGDRFQECDNRFFRVVQVVGVRKDYVEICTVRENGLELMPRVHKARRDRFFRQSNGYRYLGRCHECQTKAGAVVPRGGHRGITVSIGVCGGCLKKDATLVPSCDYHWPKEGRKAVFD